MKIALKNTITQRLSLLALAVALLAPVSLVFGQAVGVQPKVVVAPHKQKYKVKQKNESVSNGEESFAEKSIAVVDPRVNIYLCVAEGNLKITGWERNEIRVFVSNGSEIGFKVQQKNKQNNPVLLTVTNFDSTKSRGTNSQQSCLSGEDIELDVPRGAYVNVKGQTSVTTIEAIRKVAVKHVGGDISLNNIEQGITASTHEGDVMVENSGGAMVLEATNGNIVALDVAPSEIGDIFRAKTNSGAIVLQQIDHRQNEIISNSGSVKFVGSFQSGGQYDFRTQNGTISLAIPEKTSCKINALYGYGKFNSELKLLTITEEATPRTQRLIATIGDGDANVNLTTYSGSIRIRKQ